MKLLEKVYNEILDSGTYQFAVYYKDWLTAEGEAPSLPSILVPSLSVCGAQVRGASLGRSSEFGSPVAPATPQTMVSKRLYDSVFGSSKIAGFDEENFDRSSDESAIEDKQTVTRHHNPEYSNEAIEECIATNTQCDIIQEVRLLQTSEEAQTMNGPGYKASNSHTWQEIPGNKNVLHKSPNVQVNELTLKNLAKSVFGGHRTVEDLNATYEYFDESAFVSSIPQDYICPLTGQLFEDPVTLETGETFERVAIKEWFDRGNETCPITGKPLQFHAIPVTNFILKRIISSWKSEHSRRLLAFASQMISNSGEHECKADDETVVCILKQLLTSFSNEERLRNAKQLILQGGLQFLIRRFEFGNLEEKTIVAELLSCCIEADGGSRNHVARNINKLCLLELLQSKQANSRRNAVLLLAELIFLKRRTDVMSFLDGLKNEAILSTVHVLLVYLQSSPLEERPLVAVLLLHLDLLLEPRKYSIYREEAVDAITTALDGSLTDEKIQAKCCRVLLILGGHFSSSGNTLTENRILKQAGFGYDCEAHSLKNGEDDSQVDASVSWDEEEQAREEWMRSLSSSLLGSGKKSFLETIAQCLGSADLDLVRVCLTTMAWLSSALTSLSDAEFQLSAFKALVSPLKESLENGAQIEHKVLASMCLLNFSRIPECRVLLRKIANDIIVPLRNLAEVTWTAKQLWAIISGEEEL